MHPLASLLHFLLASPFFLPSIAAATGVAGLVGGIYGVVVKRSQTRQSAAETEQADAATNKIRIESNVARVEVELKQTALIEALQAGLLRTSERILALQDQVTDLTKLKPRVEELERLLTHEQTLRETVQAERDRANKQVDAAALRIATLEQTVQDLQKLLRSRDAEILRQNEQIRDLEDELKQP